MIAGAKELRIMAKKEPFVVRFLYHGELLQLVLILVHFVSKDLMILENL